MTMRGACLCGTLRYEIDGPFTMVMNCHCSMCRKHHGAPFATFAAAPLEGFRWLAGQDSVGEVQSSEHGKRCFCKICGSVAPMLMPDWQMAVVFPGNLEGSPDVRVEAHIFVGSKAPWYSIEDDLPQHAEYPPSFAGATPVPRPALAEQDDGMTRGSCLCGEVAYEMTGAPRVFYQCHCSRCRRARSAAHGANLFYTLEQFRWVRGESLVVEYKLPEAERFGVAFCRNCGGAVPRARGSVVAPAAALDTDPGMRPLAHICVASKAPWFEITDALPQLAGVPPLPAPPRPA